MTNFKTFLTTILMATSMNACVEVIDTVEEPQNVPMVEVTDTDTHEDIVEDVNEDTIVDVSEDIIEDIHEDIIEDVQTDPNEDTSALEPVIEEPEETCQYTREDGTVVLTTDIDKCIKGNVDFCETLMSDVKTDCQATSYKVEQDSSQMVMKLYCSNGTVERYTCDFIKRDLTSCSTSTYSDLPLCDNAEWTIE